MKMGTSQSFGEKEFQLSINRTYSKKFFSNLPNLKTLNGKDCWRSLFHVFN